MSMDFNPPPGRAGNEDFVGPFANSWNVRPRDGALLQEIGDGKQVK